MLFKGMYKGIWPIAIIFVPLTVSVPIVPIQMVGTRNSDRVKVVEKLYESCLYFFRVGRGYLQILNLCL